MPMSVTQQIVQFNRLFACYDGIYRRAAREFHLPELSLWILYVLREVPDCTQTDLKSVLLHSKQSIQSALRWLQNEGLVVLEPNPLDGRSKRIRLTPAGEAVSRETADRIVEAETRAFEKLSDAEREQLLQLFEKLWDAVDGEMAQL